MFKRTAAFIIGSLIIGHFAKASTFKCDGKEMSKGDVIITLAGNPKADCTKTDQIVLDREKGTIKVKPK